MNFITNNKIKQFFQGKLIHVFLILVFAVAVNHIIFSYLLINREVVKASDILGNALVGSNNYQQTSLKYLEKLQLYSEIEQVNFALLDKANDFIYFGIEKADGKSVLIKFDLETFTRLDELIVPDYYIKTGVIDIDNGFAYLGVEATSEFLPIQQKIVKVDLANFSFNQAIDLQASDIISAPYFDEINKNIYYWHSDGEGTILLKINVGPDSFQREGTLKIGQGNKSLTYAHSLVLNPQLDKGFIYLANQNNIAIVDLAKFELSQQINEPERVIYRLLGVDQELGYLYYSTKYAYKYTQLNRLDLKSLSFDNKILNLNTISNCKTMLVDPTDLGNHYGYIIMSKGSITEADLNNSDNGEDDEKSIFHVSATAKTPLEIIKVNLTTFSRVKKIALAADSIELRSIMPDLADSAIYLATEGSAGYLNKIKIGSGNTLQSETANKLPEGEKNISSGIVDPALGYAYFSLQQSATEPRKIIKIDLKTFERVDSLDLASNEKEVFTAFLDPLNHLGYFVTNTGTVIRIDLLNFEKVDSLRVGLSNLVTSWIDLTNGLAYFGNSYGSLAQISILPDDFSFLGTINTSLGSHSALVVDSLNNYAYMADNDNNNGHIVQVDLLTFAEVEKVSTGNWTNFKSARIDANNELAYFISKDDRVAIVDISPDNFKYFKSYDMPLVFHGSEQYIEDPSNNNLIYYLVNSGDNSKIVKVKFNQTNRPEVVDYLNLPDQMGPMASLVLDNSYGNIYLGTANYNYIYKVSYAPLKGKIRAFKVNIDKNDFTVDYFEFYSHKASGNIKLALYDDDKNLIWQSRTIRNIAENDWLRINLSDKERQYLKSLPAGQYWLAWQTDSVESIASYGQGLHGDGFELIYKFGLFPKKITGEKLTGAIWSIYGVKQ